ncbi:MAG: tRNA (N6-threonylcarbamoyladenosine(37)-N6)-methyltransferase TrmO [Bdellovibrionales bacterium]|nr:tRNA (N6-threonylcarbamoyladenosine(37)-N6)-methyltransferase TrmO [Bdellovibrionales bacterium]
MQSLQMKPIGHIISCFPEKFGVPKQARLSAHSHGAIQFYSHIDLPAMTSGLESFSHLWVIWLFHQNKNKGMLKKIHPPRLLGEKIGVFSTRSPHRPNPIGLSVVQIREIKKDRILINGLDMIDGTPVLDIKPYIPEWDSYAEASSGWLNDRPVGKLSVEFSKLALEEIHQFHSLGLLPGSLGEVLSAIEECLSLDPRPPAYIKLDHSSDEYQGPLYAFQLYNFDVKFCWSKHKGFLVIKVESMIEENTNPNGPTHKAN